MQIGQAPNKNKKGRQKALEGVKPKLCWLLDSTNNLRATVLFFPLVILSSRAPRAYRLHRVKHSPEVMSGALPEVLNSVGLSMTNGE